MEGSISQCRSYVSHKIVTAWRAIRENFWALKILSSIMVSLSVSGENLWETAIRETEEETGIRTEFVSLLCFRQMHQYNWGIDDMYFACLLRPLNTDIHVNPSEIADAKWMDVSVLFMLDLAPARVSLGPRVSLSYIYLVSQS